MAAESLFTEVRIPQQKPININGHGGGGGDIFFPTVLSPYPKINPSLVTVTEAIKAERHDDKPWIHPLLHQTGAILFRGFPLTSASDFNHFVEAFGFLELPYVGGAAPRTNVVGRVFTANESPPDQKIPFHHEMAQVFLLLTFSLPSSLDQI